MAHYQRLRDIIPSYVVYMGLFIGTGFLSGAIVHLPLNPVRFAIIGLIGALIFVASSTLNELKILKREASNDEIVKLIIFSILLALGVGMISGGVQHFDEVPMYASQLIPAGVLLSLVGFVLKNGINLHRTQTVKLTIAAVAFVAVLGTSLNVYAQSLTKETSAESSEQSTEASPENSEPATDKRQQGPVMVAPESDGHGHGH